VRHLVLLLLVLQGQGDDFHPAVNKVNLSNMSSEVLLDSFEGHQFNSPNDVVLYKDGSIWFTGEQYRCSEALQPAVQHIDIALQ
jgi:sugar lactone lactonase YvrE